MCIRVHERSPGSIAARTLCFIPAVSDSEFLRHSFKMHAVHLTVINEVRSIAPVNTAHIIGCLGDLPLVFCRTTEAVVARQSRSCEIFARRSLSCSVIFSFCALRKIAYDHLFRLAVVNEAGVVCPLECRRIYRDLLYLPYARPDVLRLFEVDLVISELSLCGIDTGIEAHVALIVRLDAFRQSCKFNVMPFTVICESTFVVPLCFRHVIRCLADRPLVLADDERLVEVFPVKIESDGCSISTGLCGFVALVFRLDALRQTFEPYALYAAVVRHVVLFGPAHARCVYICLLYCESYRIGYCLSDAV